MKLKTEIHVRFFLKNKLCKFKYNFISPGQMENLYDINLLWRSSLLLWQMKMRNSLRKMGVFASVVGFNRKDEPCSFCCLRRVFLVPGSPVRWDYTKVNNTAASQACCIQILLQNHNRQRHSRSLWTIVFHYFFKVFKYKKLYALIFMP